jgi:hypothetical protein
MTIPSLYVPRPLPQPGIYFLSWQFTEPRLLGTGLIAPTQGIYVIMLSDISWQPRQFRPIYIGESENLNKRVCDLHEKYTDWRREAGGLGLFMAYRVTMGMTAQQRKGIEEVLIKRYDPPCNVMLRPIAKLPFMYRPLGSK